MKIYKNSLILFAIFSGSLSTAGINATEQQKDWTEREAIQSLIYREIQTSRHLRDKSDWVEALIYVESRFVPTAISHKDCLGLMQVSKEVLGHYNWLHKTSYTFEDLKNEAINIKVGVWFLDFCLESKDSLADGITAYNYGPSHPSPRKSYYFKVRKAREWFSKQKEYRFWQSFNLGPD